jgi:hypothetical protein
MSADILANRRDCKEKRWCKWSRTHRESKRLTETPVGSQYTPGAFSFSIGFGKDSNSQI